MAEADDVETVAAAIAEHLRMVKPSAERCADWIAPEGPLERIGNGWHYSAELGWTLVNAIRGGSFSFEGVRRFRVAVDARCAQDHDPWFSHLGSPLSPCPPASVRGRAARPAQARCMTP